MPRQARLTPTSLQVAVAVLEDGVGRVLVNQRLPGTPMAGRWEFPGGKVEPDETVAEALARELAEELGVTPTQARPLIRIRHAYPDQQVLLDVWRLAAWQGTVTAREGHPLRWVTQRELTGIDLLEADRPVVTALRLPARYAVTAPGTPDGVTAQVKRLLATGHTLIQLRGKQAVSMAHDLVALCRTAGAQALVNAGPDEALRSGADGVHLNAARLMALQARPLNSEKWVAASCHDARELAHAQTIGCDFAVLGPVRQTRSHPGAHPMGWRAFAALADCAGLPVFAIGGLGNADIETTWRHHGQGVAAVSAWA